MGSLGMQEIMILFVLALIVFGPRKLPEIGKTIGKALAEFKRASNELKQTWEEEVNLDKEKASLSEITKDIPVNPAEILGDIKESVSEIAKDVSVNPTEILSDIPKSTESEPKK